MMKKIFFLFLFTLSLIHFSLAQELKRTKHFGKNPGHLKMYLHPPPNVDMSKSAPLVVVLHGCLQCATKIQEQSGWSKLADDNGFFVLYPQQRLINNPERCFRWYNRKHTNKNGGENSSIKQMIDYVKSVYNIDSSRVFITGLSAGGAMSVIMMADYPQLFNTGAIFAGGAYKSGNGMISGMMALVGWRIKSPEKWGNIVRKQNPDYNGEYPRMIIYQGNNDWVVNKRNGVELMKQWTNLHHIGIQPSEIIDAFVNVKNIQRNAYCNAIQKEVVVFYKVDKLGHALLVDLGDCKNQGGSRGFFSKDKNYFSTLWTAFDFGLIAVPEISGPHSVFSNQKVSYSVPLTFGSKYEWNFPSDCTLEQGLNTNSITLKWGTSSGYINVTETDASNCKKQYKTLFATMNDLKK